MDESTFGPVRELLARTGGEPDLRVRMLGNPTQTILEEAGIRLPADWHVHAVEGPDGVVQLSVESDELPDFMLEQVGGGIRWGFPPILPSNGFTNVMG